MPNYREAVVMVDTNIQQLETFVRFADKFKNDFNQGPLRKFKNMSWQEIFDFVQERYTLEEGEMIFRPEIFYEIGGDCDDQAIFFFALCLNLGFPSENIFLFEARQPGDDYFCHVFSGLYVDEDTNIIFDPLPGNTFNKLNYAKKNFQFSPLTLYL